MSLERQWDGAVQTEDTFDPQDSVDCFVQSQCLELAGLDSTHDCGSARLDIGQVDEAEVAARSEEHHDGLLGSRDLPDRSHTQRIADDETVESHLAAQEPVNCRR